MTQLASELDAVGFDVTLGADQVAPWESQVLGGHYGVCWDQQSYYSDPYLYVAVPAYRVGAGIGYTPAALQALVNATLETKSVTAYEAGINAISSWEASQVYPGITLLAESAYVAYRTDVSGVNVGPSQSTYFLASVKKS
jgi:hypothetical protein